MRSALVIVVGEGFQMVARTPLGEGDHVDPGIRAEIVPIRRSMLHTLPGLGPAFS